MDFISDRLLKAISHLGVLKRKELGITAKPLLRAQIDGIEIIVRDWCAKHGIRYGAFQCCKAYHRFTTQETVDYYLAKYLN